MTLPVRWHLLGEVEEEALLSLGADPCLRHGLLRTLKLAGAESGSMQRSKCS